jgi:hypothetical protein
MSSRRTPEPTAHVRSVAEPTSTEPSSRALSLSKNRPLRQRDAESKIAVDERLRRRPPAEEHANAFYMGFRETTTFRLSSWTALTVILCFLAMALVTT